MPAIYGEGDLAFVRLQNEIMARYHAHSLLAWKTVPFRDSYTPTPVLAPSLSYFERSRDIVDIPYHKFSEAWHMEGHPVGLQKTGPFSIQVTLPIFEVPKFSSDIQIDAVMVVACKVMDPIHGRQHTVGIALARGPNGFFRTFRNVFVNIDALTRLNIPWSHRSITLVSKDLDSFADHRYFVGWGKFWEEKEPTTLIINQLTANFSFISPPPASRQAGQDEQPLILECREKQVRL